MRTVAIINQKGGCGKTTSAINLAGMLARRGLRVLLVDMDPQSHCAAGLGVPEARIDQDISDALLAGDARPIDPQRLLWRVSRGLDLAPSRMKLAGLEASRGGLADKPDKDRRLAKFLSRFKSDYDACVIDCSPSIGLLAFNALAAADAVLIPVETGYFSLQGATRQHSTIKTLCRKLGVSLKVSLFATIHDETSSLSRDLLDELRRRFGGQVSPVVIRRDAALREAASFGQTIADYAPLSPGAEDYAALAAWLMQSTLLDAGGRRDDAGAHEFSDEEPHDTMSQDDASGHAPGREPDAVAVRVSPGIAGVMASRERTPALAVTSTPVSSQADAILAAAASARGKMLQTGAPSAAPESVPLVSRAEDLLRRAQKLARRDTSVARPQLSLAELDPGADTSTATPAAHAAPATSTQHIDIKPLQTSGPHPTLQLVDALAPTPMPSIERVAHLYGARQTSQGVLFVQPATSGSSVCLAGDFNAWSPEATPLKLNRDLGVFEACIALPAGRHAYRLVIDALWTADPYNPNSQPNPFGEPNSYIDVG